MHGVLWGASIGMEDTLRDNDGLGRRTDSPGDASLYDSAKFAYDPNVLDKVAVIQLVVSSLFTLSSTGSSYVSPL